MLKATIYSRILNLRNVKYNYKCYVAPGVGTQAANCEAPERTSPTSWLNHANSNRFEISLRHILKSAGISDRNHYLCKWPGIREHT